MAAAVAIQPPHPPDLRHMQTQPHSCPTCGTPVSPPRDQVLEEHKKRIAELEAQVRILTEKATSAADKLADYEDSLHRPHTHTHTSPRNPLRRTNTSETLSPPRPSTDTTTRPHTATSIPTTTSTTPAIPIKASRFSFLSSRLTSSPPPVTTTPSLPPLPPQDAELKAALLKEQSLRQAAEGKLQSMNVEIEELSATLFTQANEMVATERRARAKLEERVAVLERRDEEKRGRLERLEGACRRIERVRGMLGEDGVGRGQGKDGKDGGGV